MALKHPRMIPFFVNVPQRFAVRNGLTPCHFYSGRRSGIPELFSAVDIVDRRMRSMEREFNKIFADIQDSSLFRIPRLFSPFEWGRTRDIPVVTTDDSGRKFQIELDLTGLKPEDISISLKDSVLTVRGKKEENKEESHFVREYTHHYIIPDDVNPDTIKTLFKDGLLTIEAPLPALEESKPKEIPIHVESSKKQE